MAGAGEDAAAQAAKSAHAEVVGLAGAGGLMGRCMAASILAYGFRLVAYEHSPELRDGLLDAIEANIAEMVREYLPEATTLGWRERCTIVDSITADSFGSCDVVLETVKEDPAIKAQVFDSIEASVGPEVPVASNTSAIPITKLQEKRKHPARFAGMHWAGPGHATRFCELIRGAQTSDHAFATIASLARRMGKEPSLVEKDLPAFCLNRLQYAMFREAMYMLDLGVADVETIDTVYRNAMGLWAAMCGPFRWIDLSGGPSLYGAAMAPVMPSLCNDRELSPTMQRLMAEGATGVGNGRGFYQYSPDEAKAWSALYRKHAWEVHRVQRDIYGAPDAPATAHQQPRRRRRIRSTSSLF